MPSQRDLFKVSGPTYLTSVNWSCSHDQRIVAASLVQATYILEKDRVEGHVGPEVLAPAWWKPFHFDCIKVLRDDYNSSVIGCIYELKPGFSLHPSAPRFVVTFRGTMLDIKHGLRDGFLDLLVIIGGINKDPRFKTALDAVQRAICGGATHVRYKNARDKSGGDIQGHGHEAGKVSNINISQFVIWRERCNRIFRGTDKTSEELLEEVRTQVRYSAITQAT